MSSPTDLLELYQEWRRLTGAEGRAIELCAWEQVGQIQVAKASLKSGITRTTAELREGSGATSLPSVIGEILAELIELERSHRDQVTAQLAVAHAERTALGRSQVRLRDIRRAYVRASV